MPDTNPTRARYAQNKKAFTDVLGDPFSIPEPTDGHYNLLKRRSTIAAVQNNFDEGRSTGNQARPTVVDFFCDVERVIENVIEDTNLLNKFISCYIIGDIETTELAQAARNRLEQRIGHLFLAYQISPVRKYFTTIRRPVPRAKR